MASRKAISFGLMAHSVSREVIRRGEPFTYPDPPHPAVLRALLSTCMGGAEENTGTGCTPSLKAVQPVSEGLGKTEWQVVRQTLRRRIAASRVCWVGHRRMALRAGMNSLGYHPWAPYCLLFFGDGLGKTPTKNPPLRTGKTSKRFNCLLDEIVLEHSALRFVPHLAVLNPHLFA